MSVGGHNGAGCLEGRSGPYSTLELGVGGSGREHRSEGPARVRQGGQGSEVLGFSANATDSRNCCVLLDNSLFLLRAKGLH